MAGNNDENKGQTAAMNTEAPRNGTSNRRSNGNKKEDKGEKQQENQKDKTQTTESDKEGSSLSLKYFKSMAFRERNACPDACLKKYNIPVKKGHR